tara:strand:- start:3877 stop:4182 length:306 start_codon:yes stop_codon:yes gene_type:complete
MSSLDKVSSFTLNAGGTVVLDAAILMTSQMGVGHHPLHKLAGKYSSFVAGTTTAGINLLIYAASEDEEKKERALFRATSCAAGAILSHLILHKGYILRGKS